MIYQGPSHHLTLKEGPKPLLVFFSGTDKSNGRFDWWKSGNAQDAHLLFLNNGANEWYQGGIPGFSDSVDGTAAKIAEIARLASATEIVLFGVSMGAYAAALFAALLNARALALGFDTVLRHPLSRSAKRMPKDTLAVHTHIRRAIKASSADVVAIAGDMDYSDLLSLNRIYDLPAVRAITLRGVGHGVGRHIDKFYGLNEVISQFVTRNEVPAFRETGTAHANKELARLIFAAHHRARRDNWKGSVEAATSALKIDPLSEPANFLLATALMTLGNPLEAVPHLLSVTGTAPRFLTARYDLATALRASGDLARAEQKFQEYLEIRPESGGSWHQLALISSQRQDYARARAAAAKAVALEPGVRSYARTLRTIPTK